MNCPDCKAHMNCRTTLPVGQRSRYRIYRCSQCHYFLETYETDLRFLPPMPEEVRALQDGIAKAKATRFRFARKKGAAEAAPIGRDRALS